MQKRSFFPGSVLSKETFCFSKQYNQRSAHLPPVLVEENFSKTKNKTAEKITGQRFPVKS